MLAFLVTLLYAKSEVVGFLCSCKSRTLMFIFWLHQQFSHNTTFCLTVFLTGEQKNESWNLQDMIQSNEAWAHSTAAVEKLNIQSGFQEQKQWDRSNPRTGLLSSVRVLPSVLFATHITVTHAMTFIVLFQALCGTSPPTTRSRWRLWTMHYTPLLTKWWCPTPAGSEGVMELRKAANHATWSGRLPWPTPLAALGNWVMDGRMERRVMEVDT